MDRITAHLIAWIAVLVGTLVLEVILRAALKIAYHKIAERTKTTLDNHLIELMLGRPLFYLLLLGALYYITRDAGAVLTSVSTAVWELVQRLISSAIILLLTYYAVRLVDTVLDWYRDELSVKMEIEQLKHFFPLIRKILSITLWVLGLLMLISFWGVDIKGILVSMGVLSLAVAMATKDTIENMVSGFLIMFDRPFRIGDRVRLESGEIGDIYEIGLRSTKLLTFDSNLIIIPNNKLVQQKITNLSYPKPKIRVVVEVGVAYDSDVERVKEIMENIARSHSKVIDDPAPKAHFIDFGESALALKLFAYVDEYGDAWSTGNEIREQILHAFRKNNIEIPFPQVDVHIGRDKKESEE